MSGDKDNIVSIVERVNARRQAPIAELEAYWKSLFDQGDIPARSEIEPRKIEHLLENAFIGERVTDRMAKLRVAGSHLSDLAGMPVSGLPIATLFTQNARQHLAQVTEKLFSEPAIIRLDLKARGSVWAEAMTGQMILLPLRSDLGDVTRALGGLITHGCIGRSPRKFDIKRIVVTPVDTGAAVHVHEPTRQGAQGTRAPKTIPQAPARPKRANLQPAMRASKLRLVVCNDE